MRGVAITMVGMGMAIALMASSRTTNARPIVAPKVIALSSISVRATKDSAVRARAAVFDSLIEDVVRSQGFTVVPHDSTDAVESEASDSLGGVFDPMTGATDSLKSRAARDAARRALMARFGADLWLRPYLVLEGVPFYGARATWHGTTENTGAMGGLGGFLIGTKYGTIPGLTLLVGVADMRDTIVYSGAGGIQLVRKAGRGATKPKDVPDTEILASPVLNAHAVKVALDSLAVRVGVERTIVDAPDRTPER